jgi:hypothetical protein
LATFVRRAPRRGWRELNRNLEEMESGYGTSGVDVLSQGGIDLGRIDLDGRDRGVEIG